MRITNITELEKIQDSEKIESVTKNIIGILLVAINDWPNPIISLEEYELEVNGFIGGKATKTKIEFSLSPIDYSKNAWEAESLSQLIDVFRFYNEEMSLEEIIEDLKITLEKID